MARTEPTPLQMEQAKQAALMLDVRLTDARYYLHKSSKMNKRLATLVDQTRDIRIEIDHIIAVLNDEADASAPTPAEQRALNRLNASRQAGQRRAQGLR